MIEAAKNDVLSGMSLREAARKHDINRQTLANKIMRRHEQAPGHPIEISQENEAKLAERIKLLGEWGFPVVASDVKRFAKQYLDRLGVASKRWNDNLPGDKWVKAFCERNRLTQRMVTNISRKRAAVDQNTIQAYFTELADSLAGVPAENLINYDETGLTDDPGRRKCIVRRGSRYPEAVANHSKVTTSVMFAGTASGHLLPPFVVYKANNMYMEWSTGPPGARYASSKSGWFDETSFEDWFMNICLPYLRRKQGPKAIIGDNLSSVESHQ